MKERLFIQKAKERSQLEDFVRQQFTGAKVGEIEIQYTPIVTRIIIHTTTPGLVIGTGGERIKETAEAIKKHFTIENPQIDVQKIDNPDMDPNIVAQSIANAIEAKVSYKRLGNYSVQRIMEAGAIGCEIVIAGKFSGQRGRRERFVAGYLKKCGEPAERDVAKGFATATPKLGCVGVTVKIMLRHPEAAAEQLRQLAERAAEAREEAEEERAAKECEPEEVEKQASKKKRKPKKEAGGEEAEEKTKQPENDAEKEKAGKEEAAAGGKAAAEEPPAAEHDAGEREEA